MTTLIFEPSLTGHHLEYLHHIYEGALCKPNQKFVFAVPSKDWYQVQDKFLWRESSNIEWLMLEDCEYNSDSLWKTGLQISRDIKRLALKTNSDRVKLISLASSIPFLPLLLLFSSIKVSGIIYKIYLRSQKNFLGKILDFCRYFIMARCTSVEEVYILNDYRSAKLLNSRYKTNKFVHLSDPVPEFCADNLTNFRIKYQIPSDTSVFLHFGAMNRRKGTLEILKAIELLSVDELKSRFFIFAGRVGNEIYQEFYDIKSKLTQRGANILVKDEFCTYEDLSSWCHTSDCILIPYQMTDLSSGALGYASSHKKPVIGPNSGLIGEIIRDYSLGVALDNVYADGLVEAIINFIPYSVSCRYAEENTKDSFISTFLE